MSEQLQERVEKDEWLSELARFLCFDAWSEERIRELLANVWLDGYKSGQTEDANEGEGGL